MVLVEIGKGEKERTNKVCKGAKRSAIYASLVLIFLIFLIKLFMGVSSE